MSEPDSSQLKQEIARLHAIIDILIQQNRTLQTELSHLKSGNIPPESYSSHDNFVKGYSDAYSSHDKNEKGITDAKNSNPNFEKGIPDAKNADVKIDTGGKHAEISFPKIDMGRNESESRPAKTDIGRNDALNPLPAFVEPTHAVVGKLAAFLNASGVTKVRHSTLRDMATIILRAHNKQDCSHAELRKATGHSEGGIAKLLISMKKRGLIFRAGYKNFAATPQAQELLRKAVG